MTIEGLKQFEAVRDFLYSKMRGVKDAAVATVPNEGLAAASELLAEARALRTVLRPRG